MSVPKKNDRHRGNCNRNIEALHGAQQAAPVLAEEISGDGNARGPDGRTHEIEKNIRLPAHAQRSGKGSGENTQPEDEAGKENGGRAVAVKHFLTALQGSGGNPKEALIAIQQPTPAVKTNRIAETAPECPGASGDNNDPAEVELVFGVSQKTGQQQRDLAGNGNARAFAEQCQSYGPVTVIGDEGTQPMEVHGVASWNYESNASMADLSKCARTQDSRLDGRGGRPSIV